MIMLVVMGVWAAYIVVSLARAAEIDSIAWGVPGAVYVALNPIPFRRAKGGCDDG